MQKKRDRPGGPFFNLPLVLHALCETGEVLHPYPAPAVQDGGAREAAEDLVLIAFQQPEVRAGRPIQDGAEVHLKAAVVA